MKRVIYVIRWLLLGMYVGVFVILGRYHLHMSRFNKFFLIIVLATTLLVGFLWLLREKTQGSFSQED